MAKKKYLYLKVTQDNLSLPLIVTETIFELARKEGKDPNTIYNLIWKYEHGQRGKIKHPKYIRVEME